MPSISWPPSISQAPPLAPGAQWQWTPTVLGPGRPKVTGSWPADPETQSPHPFGDAGVAEGFEALGAAEVGDDRRAAADRFGERHPFGVRRDEEGAEVEVGVAVRGPAGQRARRAFEGEGPVGRGAEVEAGDELELGRPLAGLAVFGPGVDAVAGGEDEAADGESIAVAEQKPSSPFWTTKSRPFQAYGGVSGVGTTE